MTGTSHVHGNAQPKDSTSESDDYYETNFLKPQTMQEASRYWAAGNYGRYVETVEPIRHLLSPAELKRLQIAERRMGET